MEINTVFITTSGLGTRLAAYKAKHPEDLEVVNGMHVGSIGRLLDSIDWPALFTDRFAHYHGDFILDNILRKPNGDFVLLDWRECFNTETEWGDPAYDLAKLRHNLVFNHGTVAKGGGMSHRRRGTRSL